MLNAYWEPLEFTIPPSSLASAPWFRIIDTSLPSPEDILDHNNELVGASTYLLAPRSIVLIGNRACNLTDLLTDIDILPGQFN
jgi:glycogen operon protein